MEYHQEGTCDALLLSQLMVDVMRRECSERDNQPIENVVEEARVADDYHTDCFG